MKNKLDKYLKEKLEAPQLPPAKAWEYIQSRLPEPKEKKRIFPFWLRLSGIAATLLLMMGLGYWLGTEHQATIDRSEFTIQPEVKSSGNPGSDQKQIKEGEVPAYIPSDKSDKNVLNTQQNSMNFSGEIPENKTSLLVNSSYSSRNYRDLYASSFSENQISAWNPDFLVREVSWNHLNLDPTEILSTPETQKSIYKEILLNSNTKSYPEKEKKKKKRIDFDRFHLSAFASPLAFNTFVGNSMLSDEMSEYNTENSVTLAYGIKGAYSLSPVLKLRTGVSVVGLEQITDNVPLAVNVSERHEFSSFDDTNNVTYSGNIRIDNNSMVNSLMEMELSGRMGYGSIQQQTRYIEIPVEAELSLFQTNSIGISATGGGSTWLLSKNKIYVHVDDYTQELGEANNLNKVAFSANAGLKFDLNLTDDVKLNIEPNFRYLINPVNNIEKYNPYTVGVNAGVTVSFR